MEIEVRLEPGVKVYRGQSVYTDSLPPDVASEVEYALPAAGKKRKDKP